MSRISGWRARQWQLGPCGTDEIYAQLSTAELAGIELFRIPIGIRNARHGTSQLEKVVPVERERALRWLSREGMEFTLVCVIRTWGLKTVAVRKTRRAATLIAVLPRCPLLAGIDVQGAALGQEDFWNLEEACQLTSLRLDECWFDQRDGARTCTGLIRSRSLPLTELVVTRTWDSCLADVATQMIVVSRLRALKLNLGHADQALDELVKALSGQSALEVLAIRLRDAAGVKVFLQGLLDSACVVSLKSLKIYCERLRDRPESVVDVVQLAQALAHRAPNLPRVNFA